ncbi:phage tail protein, partial [Campylobacter jejuni]|nr:phage tail protein [Campylobacter jejuni]
MKFFIYKGEGATGQLQKVAEVTDTTTYTATNLKAKTTYRFAVSAHNGLRESEKSNIVTVATSGISAVSVTLTINSTSLEVGGIAKATVTINPSNQTDGAVAYTSSNQQVATIDQNGN